MSDVSRLPGPLGEVWEWQVKGSCRGMDSAIFFHPERERGRARAARERAAKAVCEQCPVQPQCATHAIEAREPFGTWGGISETERAAMLASATQETDLQRAV